MKFKKWILLEMYDGNWEQQNQTLKKMYIQIKKLMQVHIDYFQSGKPQGIWPPDEMIQKVGFSRRSKRHYFNNIKEYQMVFPVLADDFNIVTASGTNSLKRYEGKVTDLQVDYNKIKEGDLNRISVTVQHELQHIIDEGDSGDFEDVAGQIKYLSNEGEIRAHAKQAAYIFHRLFPNETQFDVNKIINKQYNDVKYQNYLKFSTEPQELVKKHKLDSSYLNLMKNAGDNFLKYSQWFLDNAYRQQGPQDAQQQQTPQQNQILPSQYRQQTPQQNPILPSQY